MNVYMGIDWSKNKHDIVFMNEAGAIITRLTIAHQTRGFQKLDETRQALEVTADDCLIGLETAQITLNFIITHNTPQAMADLSIDAFVAFARPYRYSRRRLPRQYAGLQAPQPAASAETVQSYKDEAKLLSTELLSLIQMSRQTKRELTGLFNQHPDCAIFASHQEPVNYWHRLCWLSSVMTGNVFPRRRVYKQ